MEQSPQNTVDFIKRCIKYFGYKSNIIQTDNGMEFCFFKDVKKIHPLEQLCLELNIEHKRIKPRTHRHNGKVERSHRNAQERFYDHLKFYSMDDLHLQASRYLKRSNNIPMTNVYASEKLSNIAFVVLEQITKNYNLPIKKCQHCDRYFMPSIRQDELYCDLPNEDGKSCREKGAKQTYKEKLEKEPVLQEYRKVYQKKLWKFQEVMEISKRKKILKSGK